MHRRLLIAHGNVAKIWILLQRLPNARYVAVPKNSQRSRKERVFTAVAFYELLFQKGDDGLRSRHPPCSRH